MFVRLNVQNEIIYLALASIVEVKVWSQIEKGVTVTTHKIYYGDGTKCYILIQNSAKKDPETDYVIQKLMSFLKVEK